MDISSLQKIVLFQDMDKKEIENTLNALSSFERTSTVGYRGARRPFVCNYHSAKGYLLLKKRFTSSGMRSIAFL